MRRTLLLTLGLVALTGIPMSAAGTAKITIVNIDGAGVGFNDPTPASPVGGNEGLTRGQQRLNVFEAAAFRWQTMLASDVEIRIRASFAPLPCAEGSVILGQASTLSWSADFAGAPRSGIWYPAALANKLAGRDLNTANEDMFIQFNAAIDNSDCLGDNSWYYGFDGEEGSDSSLYAVVLHEIGHGLGFAGRGVDFFAGRPSVFDTYTLDLIAGRTWDQMTPQERQVSSTNTGNVVWSGPNVTRSAPTFLQPILTLTVTAPSPVARDYDIGNASFGPDSSRATMTGRLVAALDAANTEGPTTTDACTAISNAAALAGNIALVDRGTCTFVQKALNVQAAGGTGMIVADNRRDTCFPPSLGGSSTAVNIPSISVSQDDGSVLRAQLGSAEVRGMLRLDPSRRAGMSSQGYVRLYAPCTFEGGSSISHFDSRATQNLLMEPFISDDLRDAVDLTIDQLLDIGWTRPERSGRRFPNR